METKPNITKMSIDIPYVKKHKITNKTITGKLKVNLQKWIQLTPEEQYAKVLSRMNSTKSNNFRLIDYSLG